MFPVKTTDPDILLFPVGKRLPFAWFNKPPAAPLHRADEVRTRAPGDGTRVMNQKAQKFVADQSGAMAVTTALFIVVLLAVAALAVDYGHMAWVQDELQKAAEAGALAGAKAAVPYIGTPPQPNWLQGQSVASQTVLLNRADAQFLTDCQVKAGYWSLTAKTLQSTAIIPTATDVPAIQVVVGKSAGHNGGPLQMLFAPIFGVDTFDLAAQAVAIISFPTGEPPGAIFPLAVAQTIVNQFWNQDPPVSFRVGYGSDNGQWTSFKVDNNSASYVKGLINNGNPTALNLHDNIYIQPGVKASNYGNAAPYVGRTVMLALVNADMTSKTFTPVRGFVALKIEVVSQGAKYIQGHFDKDYIITNAIGIRAPIADTLSTTNPPKLVN
jgi:Flp pilus assembly protein TadG